MASLLRRALYLLLALAALAAGSAGTLGVEQEGERLARRASEQSEPRDVTVRATMSLTELGRSPRTRTLYCYRLESGRDTVYSLIRFTAPPDVRGIGLLTVTGPNDLPRQWLYLPALERMRSVPPTGGGGRFVSTDFLYEDLRDRDPALDRHRLLGREELGGVSALVLESIPTDPATSAYTRRVSWIHPEALLPLRVDYFMSANEAPVKRLTVRRIEQIQGYWTIMDSTMTDLESGHQTQLTVDAVRYDRGLPESLFSHETLREPAREEPYRLEQ